MLVKMEVQATIVALAVVFLLLPDISHSLTLEQMPLSGLKAIFVSVADINPEVERLGLTKNQIKTDVELRLRKAGVRVLTEKEWLGTPAMPYIAVMVNVVISGDHYACSGTVALKEAVTLDNGFKTIGAIWDTGYTGAGRKENIRKIRESVGDLVDKFINDFLAANPK